jgi:alkanesulfonate monooxygenase SsuD/methylene tetrahydromethanopterin reductase-like flavin-dependent oxidoreductase (luciferase family)
VFVSRAAAGEDAMKAGVTLGVAIPQTFIHGPVDTGRIHDFLRHAEALGFDSAWVVEQILGSAPSLEPVTLLAYAAAITERLRLGSAVLLTSPRASPRSIS